MAILDVNFNPSNRQLRQFGTVCLVALPLVGWLWTGSLTVVGWAGVTGLTLCAIGLIVPAFLKPVFLGLTIITMPIGLVVGEAAMLMIYFGLFLPMSIVLRIVGRDSLGRRYQAANETFWRKRKQPASVRNYYHQF